MENSTHEPNFVVIGGGTGSFTILSGLKKYNDHITALASMADDGGSTGVLRDELGVLPPGDIRQCLVALSESPKMRDLFNYRFTEGSFDGHSFGNLFLSAVEKMTNNFEEAVEFAAEVLRIKGKVLPLTTDNSRLVLTMPDGSVTRGEFQINQLNFGDFRRPVISLDPPSHLTGQARAALRSADVIVIAPSNLYGSIAPALLVESMRDVLEETNAKIVYICNLVTKPHQTTDFKVHNYVEEIERFIGAPVLDAVIYNTAEPPTELRAAYMRDDEFLVEVDQAMIDSAHYQAIGIPLIARDPVESAPGDKIALSRSLIRHDGEAVAQELMKLL